MPYFDAKNNIRTTWKLLNEVINKRKNNPSLPSSFKSGGKTITDPMDIADISIGRAFAHLRRFTYNLPQFRKSLHFWPNGRGQYTTSMFQVFFISNYSQPLPIIFIVIAVVCAFTFSAFQCYSTFSYGGRRAISHFEDTLHEATD